AARAALRLLTHYQPADEEARDLFDRLFGPDGRLPDSARREWALKPLSAPTAAKARAIWGPDGASGRLGDSVKAFEALAKEVPQEAAIWFNLAVSRAWVGDNKGALEAIDRYLDLESNEEAAGQLATLAEVMRAGQGMEEESDYKQHALYYQIRSS